MPKKPGFVGLIEIVDGEFHVRTCGKTFMPFALT